MMITFRYAGLRIRQVDDEVRVESLDGDVLSTHGLGITTITGTAGPLTPEQRREVRERLASLARGPE